MKKKIHLPDHQVLWRVGVVLFISTVATLFFITCRLRGLSQDGRLGRFENLIFGPARLKSALELAPSLLRREHKEGGAVEGRAENFAALARPAGGTTAFPSSPSRDLEVPILQEPEQRLPEPAQSFRREALDKARIGNLEKAVELLGQAVKLLPEEPILKREMSHLLSLSGWRDFEAKNYLRARVFFQEALFYWPENLEAVRGMAFAYFQERDRKKAEEWLIRFFELGGDRPEAYTLIGRICYESDRLAEALEYFQISLSLCREQPEVAEMMKKLARELKIESSFERSESRHFLIKYEGRDLPDAARMVEGILEEAYSEVGRDLDFYPELPIIVILYTDEQFRDVTRSPGWAGAVFDGKIRLPVKGLLGRSAAVEQIIYHEFTHALVHEASQGRAPLWLHEGLAQRSEKLLTSPQIAGRLLVAGGGPFSLPELEAPFVNMSEAKAKLAYLESWLAVRYLEETAGPFALPELIHYLAEGEDAATALRRVTGSTYEKFNEDFAEWVLALAAAPGR